MKDFRNAIILTLLAFGLTALVIYGSSDADSMSKPIVQSKSHFQDAMKVVLEHEGFLSDDKHDRGGLTKWGLSLRFLQLESLDIDGDGDVDRDDVKAITKEKMYHIYFDKFWKLNGYDRIESERIATKLLDITVNTGGSRAHKILKKAINRALNENMTVDGTLDNGTISIVNAIEPVVLLDSIRAEQADFYRALVKKTPAYKVFEKGWLRRAAW